MKSGGVVAPQPPAHAQSNVFFPTSKCQAIAFAMTTIIPHLATYSYMTNNDPPAQFGKIAGPLFAFKFDIRSLCALSEGMKS